MIHQHQPTSPTSRSTRSVRTEDHPPDRPAFHPDGLDEGSEGSKADYIFEEVLPALTGDADIETLWDPCLRTRPPVGADNPVRAGQAACASPRRAAPEGQNLHLPYSFTTPRPPHLPEDDLPAVRDTQSAVAFPTTSNTALVRASSAVNRAFSDTSARSLSDDTGLVVVPVGLEVAVGDGGRAGAERFRRRVWSIWRR
jgi:hypothetical protein